MNQKNNIEDKKQMVISKIIIDHDTCIGSGSCATLAPETFGLNNEGKAIVININGDDYKNIMDAAMKCPVMAIKIYDSNGNLIYPK